MTACSTNPATGQQQFAAFMSPSQETQVGAEQHAEVIKEYGLYNDQALQAYVNEIGRKVSSNTERPDVIYKFYVVDSPIVNAFALPGGYIYVSRGLLALANSEAELAAVLAHETGHITARHSAERYSRGVLTNLGAAVLSAAVGAPGVSQAASIGSDLYIKSYSRGQENQADSLGIRYLAHAGYNPGAMSTFLGSLQQDSVLESRISGSKEPISYFSTHPATDERVGLTVSEAAKYPATGAEERNAYLQRLNGLVFGDSAEQGFTRGQDFYHPGLGFTLKLPKDFTISNQPTQLVATSQSGAALIFDMASSDADPSVFIREIWMKDAPLQNLEKITVNGMNGAAASFAGTVNNQPMTIQLVAIQWKPGTIARFQIALPQNSSSQLVTDLKAATYSFRAMSAQEIQTVKPYRVTLVTAGAGDTVASLAARQPFTEFSQDRFRLLNALKPGEEIKPGVTYKLVTG